MRRRGAGESWEGQPCRCLLSSALAARTAVVALCITRISSEWLTLTLVASATDGCGVHHAACGTKAPAAPCVFHRRVVGAQTRSCEYGRLEEDLLEEINGGDGWMRSLALRAKRRTTPRPVSYRLMAHGRTA